MRTNRAHLVHTRSNLVHALCLYRQVSVLGSRPRPSPKGTISQYLQTAPEAAAAGTAAPLGRGGTPTAAVAPPAAVHANPALRPRMTERFAVEAMITDPGSGHPVPAGLTAPTAATGAPVHTAAGPTAASSAAVAPVPTAAVSRRLPNGVRRKGVARFSHYDLFL